MKNVELPFFVYGTLRAGESNAHLLHGAIARNRAATLSGAQMWNVGRYPMIIEALGAEIRGELIEIEAARYPAILESLDALEGVNGADPENPAALYRRLRRRVQVEAQTIEAWVYFGRQTTARRGQLVANGDWMMRFKQR